MLLHNIRYCARHGEHWCRGITKAGKADVTEVNIGIEGLMPQKEWTQNRDPREGKGDSL